MIYCKECRYYRDKWANTGFCVRHAPTREKTTNVLTDAVWPTVLDEHWCGDFEKKGVADEQSDDNS